jgi:hypothetical protein
VRRLLRDHPGETGIVLYRWTIAPWPGVRGWGPIVVTVARPDRSRAAELSAWLDDARLGRESPESVEQGGRQQGGISTEPTWLAVEPGQHTIDLSGAPEPLRSQIVRLGPGDRFLIAVRPPIRLPFRRPLPARWCLRALPPEAG